jgi:hypothetical protein
MIVAADYQKRRQEDLWVFRQFHKHPPLKPIIHKIQQMWLIFYSTRDCDGNFYATYRCHTNWRAAIVRLRNLYESGDIAR